VRGVQYAKTADEPNIELNALRKKKKIVSGVSKILIGITQGDA